METFRAFSYIDTYGRLNVVSSTQIPFHVRRILSNALDIPKSKIRVINQELVAVLVPSKQHAVKFLMPL